MTVEERLKKLGLLIPEVPAPVAAYVPYVHTGNYIFTAGQLPLQGGELKYKGKVGEDFTWEEGYEAARICLLNCLGVVQEAVGDLNKIKRVVKINGFVNSTPDFTEHPKVLNGASELCQEILGEKGLHARAAVGTSSLPLGASVEVEMIVEVQD